MGIVFDIQKFSVHDGPGIRTTVFLKGCNIRCKWCHNPESFSAKRQLSYDAKSCTGCRRCENVCAQGVHTFSEGSHMVDYTKCISCGACVLECLAKSLKIFGREMSAEAVIKEVKKDKKYYESSGGGVTFSGGEPTVQFDFLMELLKLCKEEGISACVETNGIMTERQRDEMVPYVDLFLLDYKATGSELHRELTGKGNEEVMRTLEYLHEHEKNVILRCPVIPGCNDTEEHFEMIRTLQKQYPNILQTDIMAYHSLGKKKWEALGLDYSLQELGDVKECQKKEWEERLTK